MVEKLLSLFQEYVGDLTVPNNALSVIMTIVYQSRRETFTTEQLVEIRDTLQRGKNVDVSHYLLQLPTETINSLISVLSRSNARGRLQGLPSGARGRLQGLPSGARDLFVKENVEEFVLSLTSIAAYSKSILMSRVPTTKEQIDTKSRAVTTIVSFIDRLFVQQPIDLSDDKLQLLMDIVAHNISRSRSYLVSRLYGKGSTMEEGQPGLDRAEQEILTNFFSDDELKTILRELMTAHWKQYHTIPQNIAQA